MQPPEAARESAAQTRALQVDSHLCTSRTRDRERRRVFRNNGESPSDAQSQLNDLSSNAITRPRVSASASSSGATNVPVQNVTSVRITITNLEAHSSETTTTILLGPGAGTVTRSSGPPSQPQSSGTGTANAASGESPVALMARGVLSPEAGSGGALPADLSSLNARLFRGIPLKPLNNNNSRSGNGGSVSEHDDLKLPARLDVLLDTPAAALSVQLEHAWNSADRSLNVFVKEDDPFTFHRHPVAQSTDSIRTKQGYTRGVHVFEVVWSRRQRGTHAVIGVGTQKAPLHCVGYQCTSECRTVRYVRALHFAACLSFTSLPVPMALIGLNSV